jgi:hypothetical protein
MFRIVLALLLGAALAPSCYAQAASPQESRVFELRTYTAADGKLDALHGRFREHAIAVFEKHGMTNVGYWVPPANDDNSVVFLLAYPSQAARKAAWSAVAADPEWLRIRTRTDGKGKLVDHIDELFLTPTADCPIVTPTRDATARRFELHTGGTAPIGGKVVGRWTTPQGETVELVAREPQTGVSVFVPTQPLVLAPVDTDAVTTKPVGTMRTLVPTDYSPLR